MINYAIKKPPLERAAWVNKQRWVYLAVISREVLQNNAVIQKINNGITKRILKEIKDLKSKDKDGFLEFWKNFGAVLKEGLYEFNETHDNIFEFAVFGSSEDNELITLSEYIEKYPNDKNKIYYISGENKENLMNSPQMEYFKKEKINVLLITDPVDEFWIPMKSKFKDYEFASITKGEIDFKETPNNKKDPKTNKEDEEFTSYLKELLKDKVKDVKISKRLTSSASCLVADENDMDMHLKKLMAANNQNTGDEKRILEINNDHENCFSFLDSLTKNIKIIFISYDTEFAFRAFNYNCIDYLKKPISQKMKVQKKE